jgi:hypothetical protein
MVDHLRIASQQIPTLLAKDTTHCKPMSHWLDTCHLQLTEPLFSIIA